jgi:hypothetical protein
LDDLVTDLHKEWSHHGKKNVPSQPHLVACSALVVEKEPEPKCTTTQQQVNSNIDLQGTTTQQQQVNRNTDPICTTTQQQQVKLSTTETLSSLDSNHHIPVTAQKDNNRSGTWIIDWLSQRPVCEGGNVFPSNSFSGTVKVSKLEKKLISSSSVSQHKKKKGGAGVYSMGFMKKVARMPVRDRKHILSILKKHKNKRNLRDACDNSKAAISSTSDSSKISTSSVNKDWENFVVLHGKPEKVAKDVGGIGRTVGVSYECDTKNCFDLLTKKGRREWKET